MVITKRGAKPGKEASGDWTTIEDRIISFLPFNRDGFPLFMGVGGVKQCKGHEHVKREDFDQYCFEYIIRGAGTLITGGRHHRLKAGDVMILARGQDHEFFPDRSDPWAKAWFHCRGPLVDELIFLHHLKGVAHLPGCSAGALFHRMMVPRSEPTRWEICALAGLVQEILATMAIHLAEDPDARLSPPTKRLKDFIEMNVEQHLSCAAMAKAVGRSVSQTIRLFKKEMGETPYDFHLKHKIEVAKLLLAAPNHAVYEISEQLGFSSPYYFSRLFKVKTGVPPIKYRARAVDARTGE